MKIINNNLMGSRADQIMVYAGYLISNCKKKYDDSKINWNFCMKKEPEG